MEYWSNGVLGFSELITPSLHYSISPFRCYAFVARSLNTSFALSGLEIILYL